MIPWVNNSVQAIDCSKDVPCPEGSCCSWWGFCGTSEAHCGASCAFQCTGGHSVEILPGQTFSTDGSCNANRICPPGNCCSLWGWCGNTGLHCESNNSTASPSPVPALDEDEYLQIDDASLEAELEIENMDVDAGQGPTQSSILVTLPTTVNDLQVQPPVMEDGIIVSSDEIDTANFTDPVSDASVPDTAVGGNNGGLSGGAVNEPIMV
ncbi:hypothetical protein IWQ61_006257 [Dispira simplex]|nr:hypothetical protein IWQ61_006257 [Dispira simplex]